MKTYEFSVILAGQAEIGDDLAEALIEATRSAVADVMKAGRTVARVEIEAAGARASRPPLW